MEEQQLCYYAYLRVIALKMVFVRLGEAKSKFRGPLATCLLCYMYILCLHVTTGCCRLTCGVNCRSVVTRRPLQLTFTSFHEFMAKSLHVCDAPTFSSTSPSTTYRGKQLTTTGDTIRHLPTESHVITASCRKMSK